MDKKNKVTRYKNKNKAIKHWKCVISGPWIHLMTHYEHLTCNKITSVNSG